MKRFYTALSILVLIGLSIQSLQAQRTISGTVTDAENGDPLIGANILVIGTTMGTVTDFNGRYEMLVPDGARQVGA